MLIDAAAIARLVPHAGAMCLLAAVTRWDDARIDCAADSHREAANPLRRDGRLGILCGVEYAAQAMALHGALRARGDRARGDRARGGLLASLRNLAWHADRLDLLPGPLLVMAERLHGEADRVIYGFELRHGEDLLLEGRAAVVLAAS